MTTLKQTVLTVRGRYENGAVTLLDEVDVDGTRDVLVTFLDDSDVVLVPELEYAETARKMTLEALKLTAREYEVLAMMQTGLTNREIAIELQLSTGTIRNYTSSIYDKLRVRNRLEAVARATEMGILG